MANIEKPMNPWATEDFKRAIEEAKENIKSAFDRVGETIAINIPAESYAEEYGGKMRLKYDGVFAVNDIIERLIENDYEVFIHTEVASEVEREVDGIKRWIIIEFREV